MNQSTFNIQPLHRFGGANTSIRRPREIACFSYDDQRRFSLGDSSMAYYYTPALPADLNKGYETFQKLDDVADEHLDALLDTLVAHEKETEKKCDVDIITWRGMMTKILTAPFDNMNGFEMNATFFQGTIFIEENNEYKNQQKEIQRKRGSPPGMAPQELMMYWGYKFENLAVLRKTWDESTREEIEGRENEVVNNAAQYCSVVRTGIGNVRMILGGEVDAIWDSKPSRKEDPINWVELKTSAQIRNDRDMMKYERKLLKFWAQSFLLGVPKIIVGFRDENGICRSLEELDTASIPGKVLSVGRRTWDGNVCINFTGAFLEWLKQTINKEGTWRIRKKEKSPVIEVYQVEEQGHGDILSPAFKAWRSTMTATS
ncbi:hypothetical protein N7517_007382 [Penicillium concentricum]|uniref:Decapping nuclease n=1 Tax=Penicillium concentricum TaxID=293559 RepID=A0A9W9SB41_9EURO|nr:uncharacterized protein N7517_007382 [Penicillium concentricum]KAJ5375376.1 hypothetical protein N7517_007382 [Penicillium concentricum]